MPWYPRVQHGINTLLLPALLPTKATNLALLVSTLLARRMLCPSESARAYPRLAPEQRVPCPKYDRPVSPGTLRPRIVGRACYSAWCPAAETAIKRLRAPARHDVQCRRDAREEPGLTRCLACLGRSSPGDAIWPTADPTCARMAYGVTLPGTPLVYAKDRHDGGGIDEHVRRDGVIRPGMHPGVAGAQGQHRLDHARPDILQGHEEE